MSEYTPEYVREEYARSITPSTQAQYEHKFDQMLKRVKAEAWAEGWLVGVTDNQYDGGLQPTVNPYREETE